MSYLIEVAISILKRKGVDTIKNILIDKANKNGCEYYYFDYELSGRNKSIEKTNIIMTFMLEQNDENMVKFIKCIKSLSGVYLETIGLDDGIYTLMYASKKYLSIMNENFVKKYLKDKKEGKLFKQDSIIYKAIRS